MGESEATTVVSMDKLSELPPFIIHHIMSSLSAKESAQTSILSKRWKALYTSFPILDFYESYTYFTGENRYIKNPSFSIPYELTRKFRKNLRKFIKFVDISLVRFCELEFSMQKFRLIIGLLNAKQLSSVLDRWLGLVVENRVKELDFEVQTRRYSVYTLSQTKYFAKSITSLKLSGCKLELPCGDIRLYALKSLSLDKVCITEEMLLKLTNQCSLLEDLHISYLALKHIYISKPQKLKIISIRELPDELQSVQIVVPSLEQFSLNCKDSILIDMVECPNLMMLELTGVLLTDHEFRVLISSFPLLEDLNVIYCLHLERITISTLLDGLFEVCYPRTLYVLRIKDSSFIEWLYENLMNVDASCCDSHDIKCWRHYLKDFKIGGFLMYEIGVRKLLRVDNLKSMKDALRQYGTGTFLFHLDWCFP
ncbi:hypothetical protein LWI28_006436 [Acer negundo]|uniref:F-box domain-containing protein n=1 Tax=Acer negundo TaxID=4023 RepID=A0AAD5J4E0_ACENE|nr:hypothetical protein LWI28_006436 [Acer negundo]